MLVEGVKIAPDTFGLMTHFLTLVRKMLKDMRANELPEEIREEVMRIVGNSFNVLRETMHDVGLRTPAMPAAENGNGNVDVYAKDVIEKVKGLAKVVVPDEEPKFMEYREVSTREIVDNIPKIQNRELRDELSATVSEINFPKRLKGEDDETARYKVTETGYKGGVARLFLKIYVYMILTGVLSRPDWMSEEELCSVSLPLVEELLRAELPLTDKDIVVGPRVTEMWQVADELGVDADGVERLKVWDVRFYMNCRDIDMNHALLTKHALYFTPEGFGSVCTGVIRAAGRARTMFGVDTFRYWKHEYFTNKILHRLVKNVVEDKAKSFTVPTYNRQVQIGIYWLVLIRRMVGKRDQNLKIAKIWSCAVKIGQTKAKTPVAFIRQLTAEYPQFSFRKNQNIEDIARWILGKFTVAAFRSLKQKFGVHPDWGYHELCDDPLNIAPDVSMLKPIHYNGIERVINELHERDLEQQYPSTV
ncbi:MAG: hypothetical protein COV07_04005 [Candidatus Vogelbacteria bacterium CG10_big_fil_rev_8_21_14_0_10_45_14]|uniref:Uncharacterized protein n=1 Tax=Candidatus Vogelbacteria bacterium CG10_big_fil_rev_8_21_14_0_10_45_14 TaxID=1975042 RepID=A0A2H0RJ30_9BACT|nr:MAG: hypothetical protein COV07_04005 [Candidatus Vogelbacteria bacterium CG10_big_fil_rev_8_21_14_0_10_45_14]